LDAAGESRTGQKQRENQDRKLELETANAHEVCLPANKDHRGKGNGSYLNSAILRLGEIGQQGR
jgi:hypothetical protein